MQLARAAFELETLVRERARIGRTTTIEQIDCELGDAMSAIAYVYFKGEDEPSMVLIDLEVPMDEKTFESKRDALLLGLLSLAPTSPVH